ncbi:variable large family protein (plasmid) [Borrelia coriaceae]|uniref:Variable large protein n=1 Tax=Borrelia coriaceae ATCC 43381 TaxID=1408429 RepID=W5T2K7_9SPIR|nr:variable large family protein [Borrelia coriaceae]AHH11561.1 Variable outer membrane protein [Borrelia coriaceae ATCC 43381]UPA17308.1 variable large family protein [Borrelia coriaceae]
MKINIKNIRVKSICATLFISLFLSCNNSGEELEKLKKQNNFLSSLANLGNDFLNVFTSFGDTLGGILSFDFKTPKSEIGKYFKNIENSLTETKTKLEQLVADMKSEGNPNATATETAVNNLVTNTLAKIIAGANAVSEAIGNASEPIANIDAKTKGGAAGNVDKLIEGMKDIIKLVLGEKGNPNAGTEKKADALDNRAGGSTPTNGEAGNLFDASASSGVGSGSGHAKKAAADAVKAVGAVTGADILKAIVINGKTADTKAAEAKAKDATIAGAIALRAMAKDGKFPGVASGSFSTDNDEYTAAVKDAAISAVTKVLNTLTIAIRKTIDAGLKTVQDVMKINPNDTTISNEDGISTK